MIDNDYEYNKPKYFFPLNFESTKQMLKGNGDVFPIMLSNRQTTTIAMERSKPSHPPMALQSNIKHKIKLYNKASLIRKRLTMY